MRATRGAIVATLLACSCAAGVACGTDSLTQPETPGAVGVRFVSGGGLTDTVLSPSVQTLVVEVRGTGGAVLSGATVQFSVQAVRDTSRRFYLPLYLCGKASAPAQCGPSPDSFAAGNVTTDTTDVDGRARTLVRLGTTAGPTYVIVKVPALGSTDSVLYTVQPGAAAAVQFTYGSQLDTAVTVGARAVLRAAVFDQYRNGRADAVTYALGAPAGTTPGAVTLDPATGTVTGVDIGKGFVVARSGTLVDTATVRAVPMGRLAVCCGASGNAGAVALFRTDGSGLRFVDNVGGSGAPGSFPRFSPNGRYVAYQIGATSVSAGALQIAVVDTTTGTRRLISPPSGLQTVASPRPLDDGTVLFVGRGPYNYPTIPAAALYSSAPNGTATRLAAIPNAGIDYGGVDISRDGARVAYVATDTLGRLIGLQLLTVATGQIVFVEAQGNQPVWSPSGDRVAYLVRSDRSYSTAAAVLATVSASGTNRTTYPLVQPLSNGLAWSPAGDAVLGMFSYVDFSRGYGRLIAGLRVVRLSDLATVELFLPAFAEPDWR